MKKYLIILIVLMAGIVNATTFPIIQQNWLWSTNPSTIFSNQATIELADLFGTIHAPGNFLADFSTIPAGSTINSATFNINCSVFGTNITYRVYVVLPANTAWTAGNATFNNANEVIPVAWAGGPNGCRVGGVDHKAIESGNYTVTGTGNYSANLLTADIASMIPGGANGNFGVIVISDAGGDNVFVGNGGMANTPFFDISFSTPTPGATQTATETQTATATQTATVTCTATQTATATQTSTGTQTYTNTVTCTNTQTATVTQTATMTQTFTQTATATFTPPTPIGCSKVVSGTVVINSPICQADVFVPFNDPANYCVETTAMFGAKPVLNVTLPGQPADTARYEVQKFNGHFTIQCLSLWEQSIDSTKLPITIYYIAYQHP